MAGASRGQTKDFLCARLQFFPIRKKQNGIEIALHGTAVFEVAPAFIERDAPVEADDIGPSFIHRRQQGSTVGAEINDGRTLLQPPDEDRDGRQDVTAIVLNAKAADPTVE